MGEDRAILARRDAGRGCGCVWRVPAADGTERVPVDAGEQAAWVLRGLRGDEAEFVTLSFWDSADDIRGFAGDDIDRAVFYPEDDRYPVELELTVDHSTSWRGGAGPDS